MSNCRTCLRTLERHIYGSLQPPRPQLRSTSVRAISSLPSRSSASNSHPAISNRHASTTSNPAASTPKAAPPPNPYHPSDPSDYKEQVMEEMNKPMSRSYYAYKLADALVTECARQADYDIPQRKEKAGGVVPTTENGEELGVGTKGWWYDEAKLQPTFMTWTHITFLHMYLVTVRLRMLPAATVKDWNQQLADHFFYGAETRMDRLHAITARATRQRYLKDIFTQWRGVITAYDEGLMKGDAVLAAAVWRNIFRGKEDTDPVRLAMVVSYIRRELRRLEIMDDYELVNGNWTFEGPGAEKNAVLVESQRMKEPFTEGT